MTDDPLGLALRALAAEIAAQIVLQFQNTILPPVVESVVEPLTLTYRQVGERLGGMSETSVRKLWKSGELPSVLIGGLRFTRTADLEAYVAALTPCKPGL